MKLDETFFKHLDDLEDPRKHNQHLKKEKRKYSLVALRDCPEFTLCWLGLKSIGRLIVNGLKIM